MKSYFIIALVVVSLLFSTVTVNAQSQSFSVDTSQKAYEEGERIVVSGQVAAIIADTPVTLQIFHQGNLIDIAQVVVAQDGNYAHTFIAQGPLWQKDGEYTVRAFYGTATIETSFDFFSKQALIDTTDIFEVDAGSYGTFDIDYTIRGATIKDMIVDSDIFALIAIIDTVDDGAITLKLPRESIDAKKSNNQDDTFIILIDGVEVPYKEITTNSEFRTITIEFEEGDSDIEIIGTFVVPEFGNIVIIILVVGIISTILFSTKFKVPTIKS
ncbi:MAG: PEFG-CTERM sorting domain-containing protein [Nitrosopumilaceae archaeon]